MDNYLPKGMYNFGYFFTLLEMRIGGTVLQFLFQMNGLIPGALSEVLFNRSVNSSKVIWKRSTPLCFSLNQLPHKPRKLI